MPPLPTPTFPNGVDGPIVQDANFKPDAAYVAYVDSRVRALEATLLALPYVTYNKITLPDSNTSLTAAQWVTNATGGVIFSGTLTAARSVTVPTTANVPFGRLVENATSQNVNLVASSSSQLYTLAPLTASWVIFDGTGWYSTSTFSLPTDSSGNTVVNSHGLSIVATSNARRLGDQKDLAQVTGDGAYHTIYTLSPTIPTDGIATFFVATLLRLPAGTSQGSLYRHKITIQNNGGTLQSLAAGSAAATLIDTDPATPTVPSAGAVQVIVSGQSILVQAKASQTFWAAVAVDEARWGAPNSNQPTISSITPNYATYTSATSVTIVGSNFGGNTDAGVKIGATKYSLSGKTTNPAGTQITGILPSGVIGRGDVYVTVAGTDYTLANSWWYLGGAPTGLVLVPTHGTAAGGTSVAITATSGLTGLDIPGGSNGATFSDGTHTVAATVNSVTDDQHATVTTGADTGFSGTGVCTATTPSGSSTAAWTYDAAIQDPSQILPAGSLKGWYRGDSLTGSSTATGWNDKSGNGQNLTVTGSPTINSSSSNFNNQITVSLSGTAQYFSITTFTLAASSGGPIFIWAVVRVTGSAGTSSGYVAQYNSTSPCYLLITTSTHAPGLLQNQTATWGSSILNTNVTLYGASKGTTGSNVTSVNVQNGTQVDSSAGASNAILASASFGIGATAAGVGPQPLEVAEVVVCNQWTNTTITGAMLTSLQTYAHSRYGV
jgi:hypothetical protein